MCSLEIDQPGHLARLTSIIGTIGEAKEKNIFVYDYPIDPIFNCQPKCFFFVVKLGSHTSVRFTLTCILIGQVFEIESERNHGLIVQN